VRWVLTPTVSKLLKGGGRDSTGSHLDEGRGRGGAAAQLLMVHRRGAARRTTAAVVLATEGVRRPPVWAKLGRTA
jgi:hypothetical protein